MMSRDHKIDDYYNNYYYNSNRTSTTTKIISTLIKSLLLTVSATHIDPSGDTDTPHGRLNPPIEWINLPLGS